MLDVGCLPLAAPLDIAPSKGRVDEGGSSRNDSQPRSVAVLSTERGPDYRDGVLRPPFLDPR